MEFEAPKTLERSSDTLVGKILEKMRNNVNPLIPNLLIWLKCLCLSVVNIGNSIYFMIVQSYLLLPVSGP